MLRVRSPAPPNLPSPERLPAIALPQTGLVLPCLPWLSAHATWQLGRPGGVDAAGLHGGRGHAGAAAADQRRPPGTAPLPTYCPALRHIFAPSCCPAATLTPVRCRPPPRQDALKRWQTLLSLDISDRAPAGAGAPLTITPFFSPSLSKEGRENHSVHGGAKNLFFQSV